MRTAVRLKRLAHTDLLSVVRDRFLWGSMLYVAATLVVLRLAVPPLTRRLSRVWDFDLEPYYALIASTAVVQCGPILMGVLIGFVFLESREERTLKALLVSPIRLEFFLGYRVLAPMTLSFAVFVFGVYVIGIGVPPLYALLPIALVGSLIAAVVTFYIPSFADNKVQAFAMMKILSASSVIPLGAYFVDEPWQYAAGLFPPYWVFKAYWVAVEGGSMWWLHLVLGGLTLGAALYLLVQRLRVEAYR